MCPICNFLDVLTEVSCLVPTSVKITKSDKLTNHEVSLKVEKNPHKPITTSKLILQ